MCVLMHVCCVCGQLSTVILAVGSPSSQTLTKPRGRITQFLKCTYSISAETSQIVKYSNFHKFVCRTPCKNRGFLARAIQNKHWQIESAVSLGTIDFANCF